MKIYIAGTASGSSNSSVWREHYENPEKAMEIFFGNEGSDPIKPTDRIEILESFFYMKDFMVPYIKNHWNFLLDSGAFTFFGKDQNVNWKEYVSRYCDFINKHEIDLFFELDLDNLIGMEKTRDLRKMIEDKTGKQPIPVWRPMRKMDYWHEMIENYEYVAISASGEYDSKWTRKDESIPILRKLIKQAHKQKTKVHGLGFTPIAKLPLIPFDSVDSTAWVYGNRSGFIYQFNGKELSKIQKPDGTRAKPQKVAMHNFREWVKYQKYAIKNL